MNSHDAFSGLFIAKSNRGGRGVFTSLPRQKDEVLCLSYSWILSPEDLELIDSTSIEGYWFDHPAKRGWGLIPIGLAALVNCSLTPNSSIEWVATELGYVGILRALKNVRECEEIVIDYGIGLEPGWIP